MSIVQHTPSIWTIPHFLSDTECRQLIGFAEGFGFGEATLHELKHEGGPVENGQKYVLRSDVLFHSEAKQ